MNRVLNSLPEVTVRVRRALMSWKKCQTEMGILSILKVFLALVVCLFFAVVTSIMIEMFTTLVPFRCHFLSSNFCFILFYNFVEI